MEQLLSLEEEQKKLKKEIDALKGKFKKFQRYTPEQIQIVLDKSATIDELFDKSQVIYEALNEKHETISAIISQIDDALPDWNEKLLRIQSVSIDYFCHLI